MWSMSQTKEVNKYASILKRTASRIKQNYNTKDDGGVNSNRNKDMLTHSPMSTVYIEISLFLFFSWAYWRQC